MTIDVIKAFGSDDKLEEQEFIRDAKALKTKVEQKWTAWMSDREDGIVGTGSTETEAITSLAEQYSETDVRRAPAAIHPIEPPCGRNDCELCSESWAGRAKCSRIRSAMKQEQK